jgi:hypothetical protein
MSAEQHDESFAAQRAALQAYAAANGLSFDAALDLFGNDVLRVCAMTTTSALSIASRIERPPWE